MTYSVKISETQPHGTWSTSVDPHLMSGLKACNVSLEAINPMALRLRAVPLSKHFNKLRTNMLVHRDAGLIRAYIDEDVTYAGPNPAITAALSGPNERKWRQLALDIPVGDVGQAIRAALDALGSPVMAILRLDGAAEKRSSAEQSSAEQSTADTSAAGADTTRNDDAESRGDQFGPHSVLAAETRPLSANQLTASFLTNNRKPLAIRMARAMTRQAPCGGVLYGPSGTGKGHLSEAIAHLLTRRGHVQTVRHLPAARLAAGRVYPAERDRVLSALLDELVARPQLLLLVDNLDLGLSGTLCGLSLLAEALDRGARILATVQCEAFLAEIREIPDIARRLLPIKVPALRRSDTRRALRAVARGSDCDISPAAIDAAIELSSRQGATQPAAAVSLLNAALAEAHWRPNKQITPDDVTSVLTPEWPE